jgi:alpha-galactosidase
MRLSLVLSFTPAMGYNTWNDFRCDGINAANIMAVADKMVELGLDKVGYEYVNIDDCWSVGRMANGTLIPDPTAFPDGMKAVADYVHSKVGED